MMKKLFGLWLGLGFLILVAGCSEEPGSMAVAGDVDFDDDDYEDIVSPNNALGFDVLDEVEANENDNAFVSPTSLLMALSMVYNGADGETKGEIADVLHAEDINTDELNRANASLMSMLDHASDDIELHAANSIWLNDMYGFQDDFTDATEDYFNAKMEDIDVDDNASADKINDWVKEATNDKIENIVDDSLDPNLVMLLVNALYFKGSWTFPFDKDATEKQPFHLNDGSTKDIPLMHVNEEFPYMETDDFKAVSLPYSEDEDMSMKVFLPKEDKDLADIQDALTPENWDQWRDDFTETTGELEMPTFHTEYDMNLNDTLKNLGMPSAFGENADLSKMIEGDAGLSISDVKQKTFLDVDEEGSEAAAATSVSVEDAGTADTFDMTVDRPFLVTINDDETGAILFIGAIENPQEIE